MNKIFKVFERTEKGFQINYVTTKWTVILMIGLFWFFTALMIGMAIYGKSLVNKINVEWPILELTQKFVLSESKVSDTFGDIQNLELKNSEIDFSKEKSTGKLFFDVQGTKQSGEIEVDWTYPIDLRHQGGFFFLFQKNEILFDVTIKRRHEERFAVTNISKIEKDDKNETRLSPIYP
ncbi:MAG: hypothetical protein J6W90_07350 [Verrucomicrobia bacterium]|nr:hypothetical protein [Verrucomicrobiota bacterium]